MVKKIGPELDNLRFQLKVEKSLDRVRNLAMRMKKSDDLKKVVSVLFDEMGKLGFELYDSNIGILDKNTMDLTYYGSGLGGVKMPPGFVVPYQPGQSPYMDAIYADIKTGKKFNAFEYSGKALNELTEFFITKTEIGKAPEEYIKGMLSPEHLALSYATMKYGLLEVAGPEILDTDKTRILKRFAGVLELTYTRFYDLQKAEAQAREAEIQLVLERVRAASMSMQKSIELHDVIKVISEQIVVLGIKFDHTTFIQFNDDNSIEVWVTTPEQPYPAQIHVPFIDHVFFRIQSEMTKMKSDFLAEVYDREEKNRFFRHFFENTSARNIPKDRQNYVLQAPGMARYTFRVSTIYFSTANYDCTPYTDEETSILSRFAKVFKQSYTRFLDLQKAEAQAREAEIQLALERVRARTMAMQQSDELSETSFLLAQQVRELGIKAWGCAFHIYAANEKWDYEWFSNEEGYLPFYKTPRENFFKRFFEKRQSGETLYIEEFMGEACKVHYEYLLRLPVVGEALRDLVKAGISLPASQIDHVAYFKYGYLLFITYDPVPEAYEIFKRFAKEFEQTYTRFLDLQKAEAQAREAVVQLAMERVRARTMAMHKSEELMDVVAVMFEKLQELHFGLDGAVILGIPVPGTTDTDFWLADVDKAYPSCFRLPYYDAPSIKDIWDAKESGMEFIEKIYNHKDKNKWFTYAFEHTDLKILPEERKNWILEQEFLTQAFVITGNFIIGIHYHFEKVLSEDEIDIIKRFSRVFDQSYTRFLDLQKAELQAREAQIEAALERVRAVGMAMHSSEDFAEASTILFEQLMALGIEARRVGFALPDDEKQIFTVWSTIRGDDGKAGLLSAFFYYDQHPIYPKMIENWHAGNKLFSCELHGSDVQEYYKSWNRTFETPKALLKSIKENTSEYYQFAYFKQGIIYAFTAKPLSEAQNQLLSRFASTFELTYTRFLDLQKAEAQAREAEIQLALERVRARTMAMHNSSDVGETVATMYEELKRLGFDSFRFGIAIFHEDEKLDAWTVKRNEKGDPMLVIGKLDNNIHPMLQGVQKGWINKQASYSYDLKGQDLKNYYAAVNDYPDYPIRFEVDNLPERQFFFVFFFNEGGLFAFTGDQVAPEKSEIIQRFASSFGQTYRRYLDLQKAEAQTREAQIEAALERIRARSMAMHKSEQLSEVAKVLFEQFKTLGNLPDRLSIGLIDQETQSIQWWVTDQVGTQIQRSHSSPTGVNKTLDSIYTARRESKDYLVIELTGQELKEWVRFVREKVKIPIDDSLMKGRRLIHMAFFSRGILQLNSHEPEASEIAELLKRFANVFEQTYTRFLDLKKAEVQAREAQIEASLERVRSKAMAMHNSSDLSSAASIVFTELRKLGILTIRSGISLQFKEHRKNLLYTSTSSGEEENLSLAGWAMLDDHPVLKEIYDSWIRGEDYFPVMKGKILHSYYKKIKSSFVVPVAHERYKEQFGYFIVFTYGMFYGWADTPFTEDQRFILKRFSSVVDLSFKRYFDLQKAEAQTREAVKQASLDRIRGEIASMRTSEDLNRLTPVIWHELKALEVPFFRCGVFIIDEETKKIDTYLSNPKGESLAAWRSDYDTTPLFKASVKAWKKQQVYRTEWDKRQFIEFSQVLVDHGLVRDVNRYQAGKDAPDYLALQMIPFKQGMLYVGSAEKLHDDQIGLVQALASAFSIAYSRYEDFRQLEKAKSEVELTLTELRSTQTQLIHSEKMASLGELTAGIAHEIQNPLNFVNNFSEVSVDLIEDSEEGMINGNFEEVKAILEDLRQNLEKISHHGKRASSIVKGMLQHSRTSAGEKEATDLNALVDEYLRLAYHGFRAKDKSFNASFDLHFDKNLPKIRIIPQDIGRVLLNLINNAFYAVSSKASGLTKVLPDNSSMGNGDYKPSVIISTKQVDNQVVITVGDNGEGVPERIRDKIFQPFFTTKAAGEGTGLGLSLSYDIISKGHHGTLEVITKEGSGSEFIITLPIN